MADSESESEAESSSPVVDDAAELLEAKLGVGVGVGNTLGVGVGDTVRVGVGDTLRLGVGVGDTLGVGVGDTLRLGVGVGGKLGVGAGAGEELTDSSESTADEDDIKLIIKTAFEPMATMHIHIRE